MYTLRGIFPEPRKAPKINFIKENVKQLKAMQSKTVQESNRKTGKISLVRSNTMDGQALAGSKSLSSAKPTKPPLYNVSKSSPRPVRTKNSIYEEKIKIKKGDMAEFLRRKELRQSKAPVNTLENRVKPSLTVEIPGNFRDVACQTVESSLSQQLHDGAMLTVLYPKSPHNDVCDENIKLKASGDSKHYPASPKLASNRYKTGEVPAVTNERLNKSQNNLPQMFKNDIDNVKDDKDPYLPSTYQKGVVPKYLRERKEKQKEAENRYEADLALCPPGHITLPDNERKETLKMLRNSFAELVSELNKMPIRTDTLRMRNRKVELEKQLAKLEEGIKVFSRPKVFVKIGE